MRDNLELERKDLRIDNDVEVDSDIGQEITVYIEAWCDCARKFASRLDSEAVDWVNLYGKYNPFTDTLRIECEVNHSDSRITYFDYIPTESESHLIKGMITEKIREVFNQTPQEYCNGYYGPNITMGEMS